MKKIAAIAALLLLPTLAHARVHQVITPLSWFHTNSCTEQGLCRTDTTYHSLGQEGAADTLGPIDLTRVVLPPWVKPTASGSAADTMIVARVLIVSDTLRGANCTRDTMNITFSTPRLRKAPLGYSNRLYSWISTSAWGSPVNLPDSSETMSFPIWYSSPAPFGRTFYLPTSASVLQGGFWGQPLYCILTPVSSIKRRCRAYLISYQDD